MGNVYTKHINQNFFKKWNSEMSYVLGYITADGCITVRKDRKRHPFTLNITSVDKKHLYRIGKTLKSEYKISSKPGGKLNTFAYQLQIGNPIITNDLMKLGIFPRKTSNLNPMKVPQKYFNSFVRGFFDGDGTVYIYKVNGTPQIKGGFVSPNLSFITEFNKQLCEAIDIPCKAVHRFHSKNKNLPLYTICFYIDDCEKLTNFIYRNNPVLYLPRKRKIFERWKSIKRRNYIKQSYPSKIGWQLNQKVLV